MIHGRSSLPFASKLFCLFFERFLETRPNFDCHLPKLMTEVRMHMWGEMMLMRFQLEYPTRISTDVLGLLAGETDHMFIMVSCPYVGMDWK